MNQAKYPNAVEETMESKQLLPVLQLTGVWVLDTARSGDIDSFMRLLGIGWVLRQALNYITITSTITEFSTTGKHGATASLHVDIIHTATGGFTGTTEKRTLDWKPQPHQDYIYGKIIVQSQIIEGKEDNDGAIRPALQLHTKYKDTMVYSFLTGAVSEAGSQDKGFLVENPRQGCCAKGKGSWIHTVSRNEKSGWTAEQVWGFEIVNGERCHTRRAVAVDKNGNCKLVRVVYQRQGKLHH